MVEKAVLYAVSQTTLYIQWTWKVSLQNFPTLWLCKYKLLLLSNSVGHNIRLLLGLHATDRKHYLSFGTWTLLSQLKIASFDLKINQFIKNDAVSLTLKTYRCHCFQKCFCTGVSKKNLLVLLFLFMRPTFFPSYASWPNQLTLRRWALLARLMLGWMSKEVRPLRLNEAVIYKLLFSKYFFCTKVFVIFRNIFRNGWVTFRPFL